MHTMRNIYFIGANILTINKVTTGKNNNPDEIYKFNTKIIINYSKTSVQRPTSGPKNSGRC
jgi:hypothetical protein